MCTQFGYVTVWSIVWPLAPIFAFINNYIELRTDALKICKHVRRPIGDRVESIGSWLETLVSLPSASLLILTFTSKGIISWIGAITNATLIYLFRPTISPDQSPNPNIPSTPGSPHLSNIVSSYDISPTFKTILPTLIPLAAVALAASHGFIVLRWFVVEIVERLCWRGSKEELEVQRVRAGGGKRNLEVEKRSATSGVDLGGGFWNGGEEGAREIGRSLKSE
jgi:anoctamin-10